MWCFTSPIRCCCFGCCCGSQGLRKVQTSIFKLQRSLNLQASTLNPRSELRFCRGTFRIASHACGIRRLDRRAEGCAQHLFLFTDDWGVCALCGCQIQNPESEITLYYLLFAEPAALRPGPDEQADARDTPFCPSVAGFLA